MKKIIDGKIYDTSTAKEIAFWCNAGTWRDFTHKEETLYRKKTGEYFLFGEGGPMTNYAEYSGPNSWGSGERIIPLSFKQAKEWAEEHMEADDYESEFGEIVEDSSKRIVTYSLTKEAVEKLRRAAAERNITASQLLEEIIKTI